MTRSLIGVSILASAAAAWVTPAAAQFPPPPAPPPQSQVQDRWPQAAPPPAQSQQQQQPQARPAPQPPRDAPPNRQLDAEAPKPAPKPRVAAAPANTVTCGGVFTKDTTHLKLAIKYDSRNIAFADVDGPDGTRIKATVLFPNDAKRRLEVIWNNDAARTDLSLVVINGQSQWAAPRGVKLGTALAALEKLNGRPFKLSGFDDDGSANVLGWEGGALASVPGGCRIGVRLNGGSGDARSAVAGQKEMLSNNPALKAVKPTVAEILVGY